ncbi:MAG TPA: GvpL/GvpF family gas vesicle protein [Solirubrobacteraceae bacterium]|nr:GvpL/GvpF family gas vesicle protein [Solirubrobacteraceae bacterium]
MATYVYGIVESTARAPKARGIGGAPLAMVAGDGAAALVSDLPDGDVRMGRDEVLMHAEVLDQALAQGTVLPMRFGVVMDGSDDVRRQLLERHGEDLRNQLADLAGKVEVNVRAVYEEDVVLREVVSEDPEIARLREAVRGRSEDAAYYERIRLGELVAQAIEAKRERDAQAIIDVLAPETLAVDVGAPAHERVVLSVSFLVDRERLEKFDEVLEAVARDQVGRIRFKLTGPRAPHSFVELGRGP